MLANGTTLHISGKDILQIRNSMQDSLDQVSKWCDNNRNYARQSDHGQVCANRYQTKTPTVTITARSRSTLGKH